MITSRLLNNDALPTPGLSSSVLEAFSENSYGRIVDAAASSVKLAGPRLGDLLEDFYPLGADVGHFVVTSANAIGALVLGPRMQSVYATDNSSVGKIWRRYKLSANAKVGEFFEEDAAENDAKLAIDALGLNSAIPNRELIAARLRSLLDEFASENEGKSLSGPSVRGLAGFLLSNRFARRPTLSVTDGGLVYARWRQDANSIFSVQFISDRQAEFVLFTPVESGRDMRTGSAPPERIGNLAAISNLAWVRA